MAAYLETKPPLLPRPAAIEIPLLIEGVAVKFPMKPYRAQLKVMMRVIRACKVTKLLT